MPDAFICDFVRTPFGRYGGALRDVRADDDARVNPHAGAIAIMCIGVGQGIALLIEKL